mgnify:CR=1 FL=1
MAQRPAHLTCLRLRGFGLRREPHVAPRVPVERAGLLLAAPLTQLAAAAREAAREAAAAAAAAAAADPVPQQQQQQHGGAAPPYQVQVRQLPYAIQQQPQQPQRLPYELTRLDLVSCGAEPLAAAVLEGLSGLRVRRGGWEEGRGEGRGRGRGRGEERREGGMVCA